MPSHDDILRNFPARFELAEFGDEGMALDLDTGSYHRLNASALRVCQALKRGAAHADAAAALVATFVIDAAEAARAVDSTLDHLAAPPPPKKPSAIQIERDGDDFILMSRGRPIWRIAGDGKSMRLEAMNPAREQLADWVMWAMPHALALQGISFLHASSVALGGWVAAFTGASGTGKTTTARALSESGPKLHTEDKLAVLPVGGEGCWGLDCEARLWSAAKGMANVLVGDIAGSITVDGSCVNPGLVPTTAKPGFVELYRYSARQGDPGIWLPMLGRIAFLHPERQRGSRVFEERLPPLDALALLLEGSFAEVPSREVWKNTWQWSQEIAAQIPCFRATMPNGLDALRAAAKDYVKAMRGEK